MFCRNCWRCACRLISRDWVRGLLVLRGVGVKGFAAGEECLLFGVVRPLDAVVADGCGVCGDCSGIENRECGWSDSGLLLSGVCLCICLGRDGVLYERSDSGQCGAGDGWLNVMGELYVKSAGEVDIVSFEVQLSRTRLGVMRRVSAGYELDNGALCWKSKGAIACGRGCACSDVSEGASRI